MLYWTQEKQHIAGPAPALYASNKDRIIQVKNVEALGKLAALRFLKWAAANPQGVAALPLGSSSLFFASQLAFYKDNWTSVQVRDECALYGIDLEAFPDTSSLHFVQMYEYCALPSNSLSMRAFIEKHYRALLGLQPENILTFDGADFEGASDSSVYEVCAQYEARIARLGGIGFFCDVMSSAGDCALNARGAAYTSMTRKVNFDYEHAAILAPLYGGISRSRNAFGVTIGLRTITMRRDAEMLVLVAGGEKRQYVANFFEGDATHTPCASVVSCSKNGRFLVSASAMPQMREHDFKHNLSLKFKDVLEGKVVLHTAPHHDDIMLGYHSLVISLLEKNTNYFAYLTSGSNSVTNAFLKQIFSRISYEFLKKHEALLFNYEKLLGEFAKAYNAHDYPLAAEYGDAVVLNCFVRGHGYETLDALFAALPSFDSNQSGLRKTKEFIRESEVDRMWAIAGVPYNDVFHMRSPFYRTKTRPSFEDDVMPFVEKLIELKPDVVTVAFDLVGSGPDTHFLVLEVVARAVKYVHEKFGYSPQIWGYRNVWFSFTPQEADYMVPVKEGEQRLMDDVFKTCFSSQVDAEFPAPAHDGPFSELACRIQQAQYKYLKPELLAQGVALEHDTQGLVFLKEMNAQSLFAEFEELAQSF
jgi:glucosamine-6-phosphate deaminase